MSKKLFLSLLVISFISLSSCSTERYDLNKPITGKEVSEISIPLDDNSTVKITKGMNKEDSLAIFKRLKQMSFFRDNWDGSLELKQFEATSESPKTKRTYKVKSKTRITDTSDKHGYYTRTECLNYVEESSASSSDALRYSGFQLSKEGNKYISFYGRIPTPDLVEFLNSKGIALTADPDYEPGIYTKDGVPGLPESEYGKLGFRGCQLFGVGYLSFLSTDLFRSLSPNGHEALVPDCSFKLTSNFLILDVSKPLGLINTIFVDEKGERLYIESENTGCYFKAQIFYDVNNGKPVYYNATFKTLDFESGASLVPYEGTYIAKAQNESDEGYKKFMSMRKEVMSNYTTHTR